MYGRNSFEKDQILKNEKRSNKDQIKTKSVKKHAEILE